MIKRLNYLILFVLALGIFTGCSEDDLDPTLQQSKDIETSVNTLNDLEAVINGAYNRLSLSAYYGRDVIVLGEVMSDNTASNANSNRFVAEGRMDLLPQSGIVGTLWSQAYAVIGTANIVINAQDLEGDEARINQVKGQAYIIRALAHFDLLKFYGQQHVNDGGMSALGVPYVTAFRDEDELFPPRLSVQEVVDLAYDDLDTAKGLMDESVTKEYLSIYAAYALEARIANYFDHQQRALEASGFVVNSGLFSVPDAQGFLNSFAVDNAENSIFEIAASDIDNEGINGIANIYQQGAYGDVIALPNLVAIYDDGDIRGASDHVHGEDPTTIIGLHESGDYRNVGKYPSTAPYDDNIPVIRYEEMILIHAEALLETDGSEEDALTLLNMIPENRGADTYSEATVDNVILERRKELAFEGFRFHDLARLGMDIPFPDGTIQTHQGPAYGSFNFAIPIPAAEVDANSSVEQNAGYGQ